MQYGPDIMNCFGMMSSCKHSKNLKSFYPPKKIPIKEMMSKWIVPTKRVLR